MTTPTRVRFLVLAATTLVAANMYLDRVCLSQVIGQIRTDLELAESQGDLILGAFFFSYALFQVPAAMLGKRFGFRRMLAVYLVLWSLCTGLAGLATGLVTLLISRLAMGMAEAGAYPMAASLVRGWFPVTSRGFASSMVALGGRMGGVLAQRLTPVMVLTFVGYGMVGWRWTLVAYCVVGLVAAVVFYWTVRDTPRAHPWANEAEAEYAGDVPPVPPPTRDEFSAYEGGFDEPARAVPVRQDDFSLRLFLTTPNLWLASAAQFGINLGWAFLITKLPQFLTDRFGVSPEERGIMASVPAWASVLGLLLGGVFTDLLARRLGVRMARSVPIVLALSMGALALLACTVLNDPWLIVIALSVMALGVDLCNPAFWAFAQDIGGRNPGAVLGWANMVGNFGSGLSPLLLGYVSRAYGWDTAFAVCAATMFGAAVCGGLMDARKPVWRERST